MSSDVDIVNRALQRIGSRRIGNLATDTSREGTEARTMYTMVRDAELRMNCWRFSIKRATISNTGTAPLFGRDYQYPLPADYVRKCPLDPKLKPYPNDVLFEGAFILTDDAGPFHLRYVSNTVSPERYDPLFAEALSARLAMELGPILVQAETSEMDRIENSYIYHVKMAKLQNGIELGPTESEVDIWETVRSR